MLRTGPKLDSTRELSSRPLHCPVLQRPMAAMAQAKDYLTNFITNNCAADFALLNLPKGKSLGRSKPATSSYAEALQHTVWDDSYYIQALLNCLL